MKKTVSFIAALLMIVLFAGAVRADGVGDITLPVKKGDAGVGAVIIQSRLAKLGYLHFCATGKYGDMTVLSVRSFQKRNGLPVTGESDDKTVSAMFSEGAVRAARNGFMPAVHGKGQIASVKFGELQDWVKTVDEAFAVGSVITITDYNTGTEVKVKRTGGENHADITPVDKSAFSAIFGGSDTWEKRAFVASIGDMRVAASIFGNPNGKGEYCMYFSGSKSDISGLPDAEHADMLLKANGQ